MFPHRLTLLVAMATRVLTQSSPSPTLLPTPTPTLNVTSELPPFVDDDDDTVSIDPIIDLGNSTDAGAVAANVNTAWQYLATSDNYSIFTELAVRTSPLLVAYLNDTGSSIVDSSQQSPFELTPNESSSTPAYPLTVFAPTNNAFLSLSGPLRTMVELMLPITNDGSNDPFTDPILHVLMSNLLTYHVITGAEFVPSDSAPINQTDTLISALTPYPVTISRKLQASDNTTTTVLVNDANVVDLNVFVGNGIVHGIDSVITPLYGCGLPTKEITQERLIGVMFSNLPRVMSLAKYIALPNTGR